MTPAPPPADSDRSNAVFATTQWSLVVLAGDRASPNSQAALETLCRNYWYPLYAFARRRGSSPDDAADLTQEFFSRLLEKEFLQAADREKGRFRSFLLTVFKRFLSKEHDRALAQKRGGDRLRISIDARAGEQRYGFEPADDWTPEALFERRWALTLLEQVMEKLHREYEVKDKLLLFELAKPLLVGSGASGYAEIVRRLDMTDSAARVAVHRLRERYRELLRLEVSHTVGEPDAVEDELNHLRSAIRGKNR